jgi:hypothetical protein
MTKNKWIDKQLMSNAANGHILKKDYKISIVTELDYQKLIVIIKYNVCLFVSFYAFFTTVFQSYRRVVS